ncbi:hypothetical protein ILQ53_22475 [Escherichia coli O157:H7]|nr:hypothetical protein [Escherichia coli]QSK08171.1 hypothetical protein ILQ53_22475 [Escherichia coli O157:H7]
MNFVAVRPRILHLTSGEANNEPVFDEMAGYSAGICVVLYDAETSEYTGWSDE